ncbi:trypco2 family protein [Streptomyces sp. NPDC007189]|uniref:trypco2 family protein n=1 Tax=Streptomyces sp. NPDC007189 TaxID=3154315 RepID=UPI0034514050
MDETELSEAIKAVRAGLTAAQQDGADAAIRFTVKEIVLDLGIEIRKTAAASGGVKAFVVSGEARGERSAATTHRLTVTLDVADDDSPQGVGRRVRIGDRGEVGDLPCPTSK